jgi:class 3 adenylate cyclase
VAGRSDKCEVHLPDDLVSRQHASFAANAMREVVVRDLDSTNGTLVGNRTLRGEEIRVSSRATVRIGPYVLVVRDAAFLDDPGMTSIAVVATSVDAEPPDLTSHTAPDGTVTVLFTDIAESTALNEQFGNDRWAVLLRAHNELIRAHVAVHNGFEVKNQADGFMLAFRSAIDGLRCAVGIQEALRDEALGDPPMAVRIGLHTGEVVQDDGDFFAKHVALAARIGNAAQAGQILVSAVVRTLAETTNAFRFDRGREFELEGMDGSHRLYRALWRPQDEVEPYPDGLTLREVEVLQQLAQGKSNAEIAEALVIAPATVARHVSNILNKTGLANRTEAAAYAATHGLLE